MSWHCRTQLVINKKLKIKIRAFGFLLHKLIIIFQKLDFLNPSNNWNSNTLFLNMLANSQIYISLRILNINFNLRRNKLFCIFSLFLRKHYYFFSISTVKSITYLIIDSTRETLNRYVSNTVLTHIEISA